jgi:hypothetical protein
MANAGDDCLHGVLLYFDPVPSTTDREMNSADQGSALGKPDYHNHRLVATILAPAVEGDRRPAAGFAAKRRS